MPTDPYLSIPTPGVLSPGARLGKYEIGRRLGAGGMGAVYEAVHAEIGKRVAIKVLSLAVAAIPEARARFLREAQLTSKVRHPHAVDVTDMGTEGDQTFLVMELLDGEDLGARLERTGRMEASALVDIALPVCSAVSAAHAAGIIHRDLKPQNIYLARGVHGIVPKVLDFGISKGKEGPLQALTGTDAVLGTPYYLAPEQVTDNRASSPASDQYAIGVVLYECLTGLRPFQADSLFSVLQKIVSGSPAPPRSHRSDLDPHLEAVVLRAMDVDPTRRYSSVSELARALLPFASERGHLLWRDALGAVGAETVDDAGFRAPSPGSRPPSASRPRPIRAAGRVSPPGTWERAPSRPRSPGAERRLRSVCWRWPRSAPVRSGTRGAAARATLAASRRTRRRRRSRRFRRTRSRLRRPRRSRPRGGLMPRASSSSRRRRGSRLMGATPGTARSSDSSPPTARRTRWRSPPTGSRSRCCRFATRRPRPGSSSFPVLRSPSPRARGRWHIGTAARARRRRPLRRRRPPRAPRRPPRRSRSRAPTALP